MFDLKFAFYLTAQFLLFVTEQMPTITYFAC